MAALACAGNVGFVVSAQPGRKCASDPAGASAKGTSSHPYYERLISRQECVAAYSLRANDQLVKFLHAPRGVGQRVTYKPELDSDLRKQDAAKIVIPAREVSLRSTVRLPLKTSDGTATLVTWDAWFGREFRFADTGIATYKTFQFASPASRIWFEVRTRFALAEGPQARAARNRTARNNRGAKTDGRQPPVEPKQESAPKPEGQTAKPGGQTAIGEVDARAYGPTFGPNVQNGSTLSPRAGTFTVTAETWTRYWVLIEQRANDWDLVSLWVADERHDPVLIIDKRQLDVRGSVEEFWLQYNTSSNMREGLGERVGYARNVVVLENVKDLVPLLERPGSNK
jgi:hypothetical protein